MFRSSYPPRKPLPHRGHVGALAITTAYDRDESARQKTAKNRGQGRWRKSKVRPPQNSKQSELQLDWKKFMKAMKHNEK
jgi:hypothetical protein